MVLVAKSKPRFSRTHKKRVGQHHRHTKHYVRAYHPYLPIAIVVGLGLLLNAVWGHSNAKVLAANSSAWSQSLLQNTNTQREADNESNLVINSKLASAAQAKADDMVVENYWSHNTPDGRTPWAFMTDAGYKFEAAGENLAYGFNSGSATVSGWMSSPGHRANILNADYSQVGFGIAHSGNFVGSGPETVIVAMYGEPMGSGANSPGQPHGVLADSVDANSAPVSQSVSRISSMPGNLTGLLFALTAIVSCSSKSV